MQKNKFSLGHRKRPSISKSHVDTTNSKQMPYYHSSNKEKSDPSE